MDGLEGIFLWIIAMLFAPIIALFYLLRYTYLRVFDAQGAAARRQPFEIELYALALCLLWLFIIAAIAWVAYA